MGIKGLMKVLSDNAPRAIKEKEIKNYFGQKVAIDASMSLYQFLIAVRTSGNENSLTNADGEITSHLQGMFYRTIRMMDNGIKPVYVFDGKPPVMKSGEIAQRKEKRDKTEKDLAEAKEAGNQEDINKFSRRLVHVNKEQNEEVKRLLRLMGVPIVEAPGEAEAQCAALCKAGKVFATATEDMDALTFGTTRLLRHLTFSQSRKLPVVEIHLPTVLEDLNMSRDEFIDLCVLFGCDYTTTIRGIGPGRALDLIRKHRRTEEAIKHLDSKKYPVPEDFLYKEAAALFVNPEVTEANEIKIEFKAPDEAGIIKFLVDEKGFNLERIQSGIKRLVAAKGKGTQKRLESFFGAAKVVRKDKKTVNKKNKKSSSKVKGPPLKKRK